MYGTLRGRWLPTAAFVFFFAVPASANVPQFVCWPIAQGDTASSLARRLTGKTAEAYGHSFQILDPARRMFVPKSRYQHLSLHWQACLATSPVTSPPPAYAPAVTSAASSMPPEEPATTPARLAGPPAVSALAGPGGSSSHLVFAASIGGTVLILLISVAAAGSLAPRPIPPTMQRAGEAFVAVFARPLVDSSRGGPPIQTRLRFVPRRQQLEISIAPGNGRRYPNLADHKSNVEYDVKRVMRVLGNGLVVSDRLRASGKWVVVPIRLADTEQTGAK